MFLFSVIKLFIIMYEIVVVSLVVLFLVSTFVKSLNKYKGFLVVLIVIYLMVDHFYLRDPSPQAHRHFILYLLLLIAVGMNHILSMIKKE